MKRTEYLVGFDGEKIAITTGNHTYGLTERIITAREQFLTQSKVYFDALASIHALNFKGYKLDKNGNVIPIYSGQGEELMKKMYDVIELLKEAILLRNEIPDQTKELPTISKPWGW